MYSFKLRRTLLNLTFIAPALLLAGCLGEGDGPQSIANNPAQTPPTLPAGFCDPINFETGCAQPEIINFNGGATIVVDNPVKGGINTSDRVARMQKFPDETFGGTKLNVPGGAIDFSAGEFFKVKVWSPRALPVTFKLEEEGNPSGGLAKDLNHSGNAMWQELCFDFSGQAVPPPVLALTIIFDNGVLGQANTAPEDWTFYYDDIEQVSNCAGTAAPSIQPDAALFSTAGNVNLSIPDDYAEITAFGSGSVIDQAYVEDATYSPALSVFSGTGYGANVAQVGFTGFRAGFLGAYQTIDFKVKGEPAETEAKSLPNQVILVKLFDNVDALRINLTSSGFSTALENGWFQLSIPLSSFSNVANATGVVFESDNESPTQFRMLLTDVGFSGTGDNPPIIADPGLIPDDVLYSSNTDEMVDIVFGVDYTGFDPFGSGSVFDNNITSDPDFNPAFGVTTGNGYGAQVGQLAIVGFAAGFAAGYESLLFKAKGLNNDLIRVKFLDAGEYLDINLKMSDYSTALGNGWYQVVIPLTDITGVNASTALLFETDNTAAEAFTFLLTDIGFSGTAPDGGNSGNNGGGAEPGIIPEAVLFASDASVNEDLAPPGFDNFGSGAVFNGEFTDDADFSPAFQVTSGEGYGEGVHVGFVAFTGYDAGFASSYETLNFKIKGDEANLAAFEVKFFAPDTTKTYDLTTTDGVATSLGNGWIQVSIPMSDFAANIDVNDGFLIGPLGGQPAAFSYLLTDIGFSGTATGGGNSGGADPGIIPEAVLFASDASVNEDLVPPGFDNFGSGAVFNGEFTGDADFSPAFQVTSGEGYGEGVHVGFVAFTGYAAGFAASYETLNFKVKGDAANLAAFEVKFFAPDTTNTYDLTGTDGVATPLGNGWIQVSIPMVDFAANIDVNDGFLIGPLGGQPAAFSYLLTDIGFSGTADGGGNNGGADPGIIPEAVLFASDASVNEDLAPPGFDNFGSGAVFNGEFTGDADFNPVFQVTSGEGYGEGVHVGFVAFTGYSAGFAASYETLHFKVKGDAANLAAFEVKFFAPDTTKTYDLTGTDGVATPLGNGWIQVSIPMSDFAANIDVNDGFLIGPLGGQPAAFSYLLTDIGFSGTATGGGNNSNELAVNGGFEAGNFNGWAIFENDGTAVVTMTGASGGSFAANAVISTPAGATAGPAPVVLKQESVGQGVVVPNEAINISFDLKGTAANGAIVFIEFFSEKAEGADRIELEAIAAPNADWTTYTYTPTTGPDVSRGITLQFAVVCGAVEGCNADINIDNVSITRSGG